MPLEHTLDKPQFRVKHLYKTLIEIEGMWKKLNYKGFNDALVQPSRMEPVPMSRVLHSLASYPLIVMINVAVMVIVVVMMVNVDVGVDVTVCRCVQ